MICELSLINLKLFSVAYVSQVEVTGFIFVLSVMIFALFTGLKRV